MADRRTDRRTDGRTNAPGDNNRHPPKFWLRPEKLDLKSQEAKIQNGRQAHLKKSMIAHNFRRTAPRIFILVSTPRFLGMRNSKIKDKKKQYNV